MILLLALIIAFCTGITAYVYADILAGDVNMILSPLKSLASGIVNRWPWTEWLLMPIILCSLCVSGQMALWSFIVVTVHYGLPYSLPVHIFCICFSILITKILSKTLQ